MEEKKILNEADLARERQRSESEARSIIHDLDRLYTFPEERKSRWVWELLQNAKDVADKDGVDIIFKLTDDHLIFSHNGLPFQIEHLIAILYKTSTKSLNGEGGTTGKYGTGFVTTHILNKKLKIAGVHENALGKRRFELEIDRTAAGLDESVALKAMQDSLSTSFDEIDKISKTPPEEINTTTHSFTYSLTPSSRIYAEKGLQELERNIAFTLLINQGPEKSINSVTIETPSKSTKYLASPKNTSIEDIQYISSNEDAGILYHTSGKLTFGVPVLEKGITYRLLPIENQAILYKEFPLIGTENFNLPVFIQHRDFHPTELRDGIRTKKETENTEDPTADKNRKALKEFIAAYIPFIQKLITAKVEDTYHLAKSGLPAFVENYSNVSWYEENIQKPIREFILDQDLVKTCSGAFIKIEQAKFPSIELIEDAEFYSLLSRLLPSQVPDSQSILIWGEIISQETESWKNDSTIDTEDLVKLVPEHVDVEEEKSIQWLKDLYMYLEYKQLIALGEANPIYLNEANTFCLRDQVAIHPTIDDEFKIVSKGLGRDLDDEFLNRKLGNVSSIKQFELTEFYNHLNKELISELKPESASEEQVESVFRVCCLFRSDRAAKRDQWYLIIHQLLPHLAPEKRMVTVDYDNYWRSAELWSIKYICHLLEKTQKPSVFANTYFEGHEESCFEWQNSFLSYIFSLKDDYSEVILKRNIIPTQSDEFRPYDEYVFAENKHEYFDDVIKDIYRDFTDKSEPRRFLVDTRISFDGLRTREVDVLTKEVDKLFNDPHIESKVKKGGPLNEMFLKLNNWYEQVSDAGNYLPTFSTKRATLYVLALGEGFSKQIMEIQNSGKSIEDITELAKIKLSPEEMKMFESAAAELGTEALLAKAKEMLDAKHQIERWKTIGKAAETAFEDAISGLDANFRIDNPDRGKDFELILEAKGYSIEIKSVAKGKEDVRMSALQGRTASKNPGNYALCVMTRPEHDQIVDKEYFIKESRFVIDIGHQISDKIQNWDEGLQKLIIDDDVMVYLDDKTESIYVRRDIWRNGISFNEFVEILNQYFAT
jgi:hypothetical protein